MSFFNFNFALKRSNLASNDKENMAKRSATMFTPQPTRNVSSNPSASSRNPFAFNITPTPRSIFGDRSNENRPLSFSAKSSDAPKSQNESFKPMDKKTGMFDNQFKYNLASESTAELKQKISAELEKIETYKRLSEIESERKTGEIKELRANKMDLENRIASMTRDMSDLKIKVTVERSERNEVIGRMNNTREMVYKVKEFLQNIEKRMDAFEDVRNAMEMIDQHRAQQFNSLTEYFVDKENEFKLVLTNSNQKIERLKDELKDKSNQLLLSRENFNRFNIRFNRLNKQKQICDQTIAMKESLIERFEEEFKSQEAIIEGLHQEKNELNEAIVGLEANAVSDKLRIEELVQNNKQLEEDIRSRSEDFNRKEQELLRQLKELAEANEQVIKSSTEENERMTSEVQELKENIEQLKNEMVAKDERISQELSTSSALINELEETKTKLGSKKERMENLYKTLEEKEGLLGERENFIQMLDVNIEALCKQVSDLNEQKAENQTMIEELESKLNQSFVEKERTEEKLSNDLNLLKTELEEFRQKISDLEARVKELKQTKDLHETTINNLESEKQKIEEQLEKEKKVCENEKNTMANLMESAKKDFMKRINDREAQVNEYRREKERYRINNETLTKKNQLLQERDRVRQNKLVELTFQTIESRPEISASPILTPKFISPIESARLDQRRASPQLPNSQKFEDLLAEFEDDEAIGFSAKKEWESKVKTSQNSQPIVEKSESMTKSKAPNASADSKLKKVKAKSNTDESYGQRFEKIKKQNPGIKHRIESPVRVNMSLAEGNNSQKGGEEPIKKKPKMNKAVKTYGKDKLRVENINKGRPTPTKMGDLSWLDFESI